MWNPFKTKRPKIQDEFFGELLCMEVKEPNQNYFEGRRNFKPTAKDIEVVIAGKLGGPTQQQKYFFNWVETNYWRLIEQIGPFVQQEFSKWDKSFRISNFTVEFESVFLNIPLCDKSPIEWKISFDSKNTRQVIYTVTLEMLDDQPIGIEASS